MSLDMVLLFSICGIPEKRGQINLVCIIVSAYYEFFFIYPQTNPTIHWICVANYLALTPKDNMEFFFHAFHFNVINSLMNHQSLVLINIQFLNPTRSPIQLCSDGKFVIKKVKTNFHYHSTSFNDFTCFLFFVFRLPTSKLFLIDRCRSSTI